MSKGDITPIAQTYYEVSNIKHEVVKAQIDYSKPILTWLPDSVSDKGKEGISLLELEKRLNSYEAGAKDKINNSGFLKGLYNGYFEGKNCNVPAPYLCFDIDVKNTPEKKENLHLLNPPQNKKIFEALEKIAILVWRSRSGNGIAGILYVPQLAQYTHETRALHKLVGDSLTTYLSEYLHKTTGVEKVKFDDTQSKFRQVRLVAPQTAPRKLNTNPFVFSYITELKTKRTTNGVVKYRDKHYRKPKGSISD